MVSSPRRSLRNNPLYPVLKYSSHFSYPLTASQVHHWQISTRHSLSQVKQYLRAFPALASFHFLPGQSHFVALRRSRLRSSRAKFRHARSLLPFFASLPTITAVFITGALSMSNSPETDDIDLMLVTIPHTLWLTRLIVALYLKARGMRRDPHLPEHSSPQVKDKFCDNLWLDSRHLAIQPQRLYQAHEILQAKCLFDRSRLHHQFLAANPWVGDYLPIAYSRQLSRLTPPSAHFPSHLSLSLFSVLLAPLNYLAYLVQSLYMKPRHTREKIGLGYAFFHPRSQPDYDNI